MRILILTDEIYPDTIGGVGKSIYNLCAAWIRDGQEVTVLVRSLRPNTSSISTIGGIQIRRFQGPLRGHLFYRLFPFSILVHVFRWLRHLDRAFDIIYVNNPWYLTAVGLARAYRQTPTVAMVHMPLEAEIRINAEHRKYGLATPLARMAASAMKVLENQALFYADTILTNGDFVRKMLNLGYSHTIKLGEPIPLGIDTTLYTLRDKENARGELHLPVERRVLLTVRRLEGRMGLENLVIAMHTIKAHYPEALLLIGGQGYLKDQLESLIQTHDLRDHVRLVGFIDEADLPIYMASADLFVLPTEAIEGFGLATIEALACGLPVIGTPIGHTPEILNPIDPRLVSKDASPDAIAQTVLDWLGRPGDLQRIRARCRKEVEDHYSVDHVAQHMIEIFEQVIARRAQQSRILDD